jgi:hypothetical protein
VVVPGSRGSRGSLAIRRRAGAVDVGDVAHWLCVSRLRGVPQGEASSIVHMTASPCLSGDCEACAGNKARLPRLSEFRAKATSGNTDAPRRCASGGNPSVSGAPIREAVLRQPRRAASRPALRVISRPHSVPQARIDRPVDKRRASHPVPLPQAVETGLRPAPDDLSAG